MTRGDCAWEEPEIFWRGPEHREIVGMIWADREHEFLFVAMDDGSVFKVNAETGESEQVTKARMH